MASLRQRRKRREALAWRVFLILAFAVAGAYAVGALAALGADVWSYLRSGTVSRGFSTGISMLWGMFLGGVIGGACGIVSQREVGNRWERGRGVG